MKPEHHAHLSTREGDPVALQSVHVEGRIDGLLMYTRVRQSYRNDGTRSLETVYTFPLAHGATLLGLDVTLGDQRLSGQVMPRPQASARYEQAIDAGDLPVLVEQSAPGLYTASLGNLQPGDEAVIELQYAQLLRFEQGRVRLSVPTVVAPRYGNAQEQGGLMPHESVATNVLAAYPFTLQLDLTGQLATGRVSCPSHAIQTQLLAEGLRVSLNRGGWMDRDFVLLVEGLEGCSFATSAADNQDDGDETMVLASFCPALPQRESVPVMLKVLVDCSGSMAGDSIAQARTALHEIGAQLDPDDHLSFTRFGSSVRHEIAHFERCSDELLSTVFARAVASTQADLGGTELELALRETCAIPMPAAHDSAVDILLITDGEIWNIEQTVELAQRSGHRIHAIGVGSAPADSLLRELAERTGGSCELVTPHETIADAMLRTFRRLRGGRVVGISVDWSQTPLWQSSLPSRLLDGETVHVFARMPHRPESPPLLRWTIEGSTQKNRPAMFTRDDTGVVARMGGVRRLAECPPQDQQTRETLALRYQLVSACTSLILVHERAEGEKAEGLPMLQQVAQMHAAGHGGAGSVLGGVAAGLAATPFGGFLPNMLMKLAGLGVMGISPYGALHKPAATPSRHESNPASEPNPLAKPHFTPQSLLRLVEQGATAGNAWSDIVAMLDQRTAQSPVIRRLLKVLTAQIGDHETAWAILLEWLATRLAGQARPARHAERLLRHALASTSGDDKAACHRMLGQHLPQVRHDSWGS